MPLSPSPPLLPLAAPAAPPSPPILLGSYIQHETTGCTARNELGTFSYYPGGLVPWSPSHDQSPPGGTWSHVGIPACAALCDAYAEAKNVCDIVPGLNAFCLGSIGGGQTTFSLDVLGVTLSLTLHFNVVDVCLVDLLPCNLIPL